MGRRSRAWLGLCAGLLVSTGGLSPTTAQEAPAPPLTPPPAAPGASGKAAGKTKAAPPKPAPKPAPKSTGAKPAPKAKPKSPNPSAPKAPPGQAGGIPMPPAGPEAPAPKAPASTAVVDPAGVTASATSDASEVKAESGASTGAGGTTASKPGAQTKKPAPRPAKPLARLPGSEPGKPDEKARRLFAGKPVESVPGDPRESTELKNLRELDRTLFPPEQGGATGPWPKEGEATAPAPKVENSGLPSSGPMPLESVDPTNTDLSWLAALEKPDMPVRLDPSVVRYLTYYRDNPRGRNLLAGWVKRSGRYGAAVRKVLRDHHLPEDLVWLALVESGFDPSIHSHAGAAGLWQFVPSTGRIYGLSISRKVDERLDPERATLAAVRHLSDLHTRFGNWELAFAAYNMGYGGLLASIRKFNTNDYWELRRLEAGLPYETALYVPKIFSIAIAARNCKVFGCDTIVLDDPEPFGEVTADKVSVAPGVSLQEVADAVGATLEAIQALNPHLVGTRLPVLDSTDPNRESWTVYVPHGKAAAARKALPRTAPQRHLATYRLRWGEPLEHVAARLGTSTSQLERLNDLASGESVRAGSLLAVPAHTHTRPDAEAAAAVAGAHGNGKSGKPIVVIPDHEFAVTDRRRVFYQATLGDTLEGVADACGVTVADVRLWNHLDDRATLQDGMTLQLYLPTDAHPSDVLLLEASQVEVVPIGSQAFFHYFVGGMGRERQEVTAQAGDTWAKIAARHGLTLGMLERINRKSRRSKIEAGDRIVVYAKRSRHGTAPVSSRVPTLDGPKPEPLESPADATDSATADAETGPAERPAPAAGATAAEVPSDAPARGAHVEAPKPAPPEGG